MSTIPSWFSHKSHISMSNTKGNLYCYYVFNSVYQGVMSMCSILKWEGDWTVLATVDCGLTILKPHRPVIWQLPIALKYLHSHSYNEKRGSVSSLPHLCIRPNKNLTTGSGQDIKINFTTLHPALHNCSLSVNSPVCVPILGRQWILQSLASAVIGFFKKQNEMAGWSKVL